jgi:hypothetical protein
MAPAPPSPLVRRAWGPLVLHVVCSLARATTAAALAHPAPGAFVHGAALPAAPHPAQPLCRRAQPPRAGHAPPGALGARGRLRGGGAMGMAGAAAAGAAPDAAEDVLVQYVVVRRDLQAELVRACPARLPPPLLCGERRATAATATAREHASMPRNLFWGLVHQGGRQGG